MDLYRKKPVVIEAIKWTGLNQREMFIFLSGESDPDFMDIKTENENFKIDHGRVNRGLIIKTLEGEHVADLGDFIIKGVKGEFYPCKPDIFALTYELVEE